MWTKHHQFLEVVKSSWNIPIHGDALYRFAGKLKRLKRILIEWNKQSFGNVFRNIVEAENQLKDLEIKIELDNFEDCEIENNRAKDRLNDCLASEELFWKQHSKAKWLKEGDKNTHFFHVSATMKKHKSKNFGSKILKAIG